MRSVNLSLHFMYILDHEGQTNYMSRFFLFHFQVRRTNCFANDLVPFLIYQAHLLDPQRWLNLFPRQEFRIVFCFQMLC